MVYPNIVHLEFNIEIVYEQLVNICGHGFLLMSVTMPCIYDTFLVHEYAKW